MGLRELLVSIAPELDGALPLFKIGNQTSLNCDGSCNLSKPYQVELEGKIKTDSLSVMNIVAKDLDGDWTYKNDVLRISVGSSTLMDGTFSGGFSYDRNQKCGDFIGECKDISLENILRAANQNDKSSYPGVITARCSLRYHLGWGNVPHQLNGIGHLSIKNSDIWRVPGLNALGRALNFANGAILGNEKDSNIGKITKAEANVAFMGTRLSITDFKTDGTLLALQGSGDYVWDEDYVDFTVNSRILRRINLLSLLFRPLTGAFYASLKGPRNEAKWKVSSYFGKMLIGE
jgi:hypothetical protein